VIFRALSVSINEEWFSISSLPYLLDQFYCSHGSSELLTFNTLFFSNTSGFKAQTFYLECSV
jgi:hypothetical protein